MREGKQIASVERTVGLPKWISIQVRELPVFRAGGGVGGGLRSIPAWRSTDCLTEFAAQCNLEKVADIG